MVLEKYEPKKIEPKWAKKWVDDKTYKWIEDSNPENNYLIDVPPPYPYRSLHAGNFVNVTYQDFMARYKRMKGFSVLHPWGWDCHGLPAELHIESTLKVTAEEVGITKFRKLCKENLLVSIDNIRSNQAIPLGMSIDWDRQYYTMNDDYKKMIQESFIDMKENNFVYRGDHPVTWCPSCHTAIAEAQMDRIEREGELHYIKLPLIKGEDITIATTRPELMSACVAVFVNPKDKRYTDYIGKKIKIPFTNQIVEIIANKDADPEFGTGAVYHCTFGDKDDWKWVVDFKLPIRIVINEKGIFTKESGILKGLNIKQGRKKIVEELKKEGLYVKSEPSEQALKVCERCKTPIELIVKKQWYFATTKLKKEIMESANNMNFFPKYMIQRLKDWVDSASWDWVISRQRYFATPFPVWYCEECNELIIADKKELPVDPLTTKKKCPKCKKEAIPEKDVMDTWMDSSLTALYVNNWLSKKREDRLSDLRDQGEDIIKTWLYYSISRCVAQTGKKPFREVLINGMLLGLDGKKMSKRRAKALVEPSEIIEKYSSDVYRQWVGNSNPGEDIKMEWKEMEYAKNFLNKLWNIGRFIQMFKMEGEEEKLEVSDIEILEELNRIIVLVTVEMNNCNWGSALRMIRNFAWYELADYYVEMIKYRLYGEDKKSKNAAIKTIREVFLQVLKMMSPFCPFLTEELYNELYDNNSIHLTNWPKGKKGERKGDSDWNLMKKVIDMGRQYKNDSGKSLGSKIDNAIIQYPEVERIKKLKEVIKGTLRIKNLEIKEGEELSVEF